jgi:hypothetical protein
MLHITNQLASFDKNNLPKYFINLTYFSHFTLFDPDTWIILCPRISKVAGKCSVLFSFLKFKAGPK